MSIAKIVKCCKANFCVLMVLISFKIIAQAPPMLAKVYGLYYAEEALNQMINYKIPASVILAQAIFESNSGNSFLAKKSNNHFGIKCHLEWGGDTIIKNDDTLNECFRKYNSIHDSYTDHSLFLKSRSRYSGLFNLDIIDYKGWCYGLKNAGYATYNCYAEELIKIIETNNLYELDRAEGIESGVYVNFKLHTLKQSNYVTWQTTQTKNCNFELLFTNEKDVLLQSINLLIEQFEEDDVNLDIALEK